MNVDLTKAEEQVMQILWKLEKGFVKEIVEEFPSPRPAYNTVSTIIRILQQKNIVGHKAFGRTHQYFPKIQEEEYIKSSASSLVQKYFSGSMEKMLSFFVREKDISLEDLERIIKENKK